MTTDLLKDLKALREHLPQPSAAPSMAERARTYQNVGGFILRQGRLDAIIEALEKINAE